MRDWTEYVRTRLTLPDSEASSAHEVVQEVASQLEDCYLDAIEQGVTETEADQQAREHITDWEALAAEILLTKRVPTDGRAVRHLDSVEQALRASGRRWSLLADLSQDLRYGVRSLWQRPGFTLVAVLSLGLGIGVTSAMFSFANAVILRPLPVADVDSLVAVYTANAGGDRYGPVSYPDYADLRDRNEVFTGLAAQIYLPMALKTGDRSEVVVGQLVSWNYWSVLGVDPILGRSFFPEEDATNDSHPVAILSYRSWVRAFEADPQAIGAEVVINGHTFTVIGVAPEGFRGLHAALATDVWVPLRMVRRAAPFTPQFDGRIDPWLQLVGRMRPEVGIPQLEADLELLATALESEYPELNGGKLFPAVPLSHSRMGSGPDQGVRRLLALLLSAVGVVLLIASFNVANLNLARATTRQQEIRLRRSLGASRARILRQLFTESMLLAIVAGAVGLLLARWTSSLLVTLQPPMGIPIELDLSLDTRVLGFTLLLSVLTAVLFGLAPGVHAAWSEHTTALKTRSSGHGRSRRTARLQSVLVAGQVALSLVLLIGAGLLLQSLGNALAVDPGIALREGLIVDVSLGFSQYDEVEGLEFYQRLHERLGSLPGVESITAATFLPLGEVHGRHDVYIEGYEPQPDEFMVPLRNMVDAAYFDTLGVQVLHGRGFMEYDRADTVPVAIVNETMASRYWPGGNAIGGRIQADFGVDREVIGIVADGKYRARLEEPEPYLYIPLAQAGYNEMRSFVLRTRRGAPALAGLVRHEVRTIDPDLPEPLTATVSEYLARTATDQRAMALLVSAFGILALTLAVVGIYGVMSYLVSQRTHEFGVRLALGARAGEIVALVIRRGMTTTLIGLGIGLGLALLVGHLLGGFLYHVNPLDPTVYAAVALLIASIAALACYLPARVAARADPCAALRAE